MPFSDRSQHVKCKISVNRHEEVHGQRKILHGLLELLCKLMMFKQKDSIQEHESMFDQAFLRMLNQHINHIIHILIKVSLKQEMLFPEQ